MIPDRYTQPGLLFALLLTAVERADAGEFDSSRYAYFREFVVESAEERVVTFRLDDAVFDHCGEDFADLRLIDWEAESPVVVPFALERRLGEAREDAGRLASRITAVEEKENNLLEVEARLTGEKSDARVSRIVIDTPLKDFERRVRVYGSEDGTNWIELVSGSLIFDYSRYLDFRRTVIDLPPVEYRRFRIVIDGAVETLASPYREIARTEVDGEVFMEETRTTESVRPFRIDALRFLETREDEEVEKLLATYETATVLIQHDKESNETWIDVESRDQPLLELELLTEERNFRRVVKLLLPATGKGDGKWVTAATGRVFRYDLGGLDEERLRFPIPEQRYGRYRVAIAHGDNPPVAIGGIEQRGPYYDVFFVGTPGHRYRLYYGSAEESLKAPRYDTAVIRLARKRASPWTLDALGDEQENPEFRDRGSGFAFFESGSFFLIAIVIGVVLLAIAIMTAARRVEA